MDRVGGHGIVYRYVPHRPLIRYAKLRVAHAPEMPGTFSPPPRISDPDMHHGTCATHVLWCMSGSLTSGFILSPWREKRSRHSWRMRNPQFYVSGKRPIQRVSYAESVSMSWRLHCGFITHQGSIRLTLRNHLTISTVLMPTSTNRDTYPLFNAGLIFTLYAL